MSAPRYVIAGAARPRSGWFAEVSQWANASAIPAEFIKCVGIEELRARIASGRVFSAVLLDGALPGVDRDLLSAARDAAMTVIVVADPAEGPRWSALGAHVVLAPSFDRAELLDVLASFSELISHADPTPEIRAPLGSIPVGLGRTIACLGPGGTGSSTVAMAAAQSLASDSTLVSARSLDRTEVVLVDFCLRAEQAMLHDTQAVTPGIQELVDAHRLRHVDPDAVRTMCFAVHGRGYDLLIGLRRRRLWSTLRTTALAASVEALRSTYRFVVADTDGDLDGEDNTGSQELEERNVLARTVVREADLVLVVGQASLKGLHSLVRTIQDVRDFGVQDHMIQPVLNAAPGSPKARAGYTLALAELLGSPRVPASPIPTPVFVPVSNVDASVRAAGALPTAITSAIGAMLRHHLTSSATRAINAPRWHRLAPGFLRNETARSAS